MGSQQKNATRASDPAGGGNSNREVSAMNGGPFDMRSLLERAGFRVRGGRADCAHCNGRSRLTVSFTNEVAFCHRCKWKANVVTLAHELGLFRNNPDAVSSFHDQSKHRARFLTEIKAFEIWRDSRICTVSNQYRELSRKGIRATYVLSKFPESEAAWEALARFYHARAKLLAAFDWLMFTKVSDWLEQDSGPIEVYKTWRSRVAQ